MAVIQVTEVSVRYIVDDVDEAVDFYTTHLAFEIQARPGPGFAMLRRGGLRLLLNSPEGGGGAGQVLSDGSRPEPGGWNRFQLEITDLDATVASLRGSGATLRGDVITGRGGRQALLQDPAGNLIELFQPYR
jgi:catechol 2,3-dioxygenase-like lactoylglutathione lyase family enzyme